MDSARNGGLVASALAKAAVPLAVAISAIFLSLALLFLRKDLGLDFGVYWRTANEPVALAYTHREALPFPYAPTMLLWIEPLGLLPKWPAFALWSGAGVIGLAAACRRHLSAAETVLALASPPAVYCLLQGQIAVVLAAVLLWACSSRHRIAAGVGFTVIASIKPQLVSMAPLLLLAGRDWKALTSAAAAFAAILAASVLAYGLEPWAAWLGSLDHFRAVIIENGVLGVTITPAAIAELRGWPPLPFLFAGAVLGVLLAFKCRSAPPLIQAAAIATGSLLAAPYAVIYDLAAVAPFLAWSIFRGRAVAVIALSGGLNPLPLLLTGLLTLRRDNRDNRDIRSA